MVPEDRRARLEGRRPAGPQYVVKTKGVVELGVLGCASCHTRVMPDGSILKGAQGNQPIQRAAAFGMRAGSQRRTDGINTSRNSVDY